MVFTRNTLNISAEIDAYWCLGQKTQCQWFLWWRSPGHNKCYCTCDTNSNMAFSFCWAGCTKKCWVLLMNYVFNPNDDLVLHLTKWQVKLKSMWQNKRNLNEKKTKQKYVLYSRLGASHYMPQKTRHSNSRSPQAKLYDPHLLGGSWDVPMLGILFINVCYTENKARNRPEPLHMHNWNI